MGCFIGWYFRDRRIRRWLERRRARQMVKAYGSDGVRGLLYGDFSQFIMQIIDCAVVAVFGFVMAYVWFKVSDLITPIRVSKETEIEGLDGPEMGVLGYPDFQLHSGQRIVE